MQRFLLSTAVLTVSLLLAGCSGLDDLRVTNQYPFAVELRKGGEKLATLAPGETGTFDGEGGDKGDAAKIVECVDAQGKALGLLSKVGHDIQRESNGSINGSGTLVVTVGPN